MVLLCVSKLLFVSMRVWQCYYFRITDKLLSFDLYLSILIFVRLSEFIMSFMNF